MLREELCVQEREFDRVPDVLDLLAEPADLVVGDVRDLLEDDLLDLLLRKRFQRVARPRVVQDRIPGPETAPSS